MAAKNRDSPAVKGIAVVVTNDVADDGEITTLVDAAGGGSSTIQQQYNKYPAKVAESPIQTLSALALDSYDGAAREESVSLEPSVKDRPRVDVENTEALEAARHQLAAAKRIASTLEAALEENQAESKRVREELSTEKDTTLQQARQLSSLR